MISFKDLNFTKSKQLWKNLFHEIEQKLKKPSSKDLISLESKWHFNYKNVLMLKLLPQVVYLRHEGVEAKTVCSGITGRGQVNILGKNRSSQHTHMFFKSEASSMILFLPIHGSQFPQPLDSPTGCHISSGRV